MLSIASDHEQGTNSGCIPVDFVDARSSSSGKALEIAFCSPM